MKIKSIKAGVHRLSVTVPLLKQPIDRKTVFCEVETDDGYVGHADHRRRLPAVRDRHRDRKGVFSPR